MFASCAPSLASAAPSAFPCFHFLSFSVSCPCTLLCAYDHAFCGKRTTAVAPTERQSACLIIVGAADCAWADRTPRVFVTKVVEAATRNKQIVWGVGFQSIPHSRSMTHASLGMIRFCFGTHVTMSCMCSIYTQAHVYVYMYIKNIHIHV